MPSSPGHPKIDLQIKAKNRIQCLLLTSLALGLLHIRTKTQENFLSVLVIEEAEEVKIRWN